MEKGETTFYFVHDRLGDVTFLSLVLVENILFDPASGLLIGPRKEGIRYSGREKTQKNGKWITMTVVPFQESHGLHSTKDECKIQESSHR